MQGTSEYETYETLFEESDGWATSTAVLQMNANGIPLDKIIVGKPVTTAGVVNTGYDSLNELTSIIGEALSETSWRSGVMGWEYSLDRNGTWIAGLF